MISMEQDNKKERAAKTYPNDVGIIVHRSRHCSDPAKLLATSPNGRCHLIGPPHAAKKGALLSNFVLFEVTKQQSSAACPRCAVDVTA